MYHRLRKFNLLFAIAAIFVFIVSCGDSDSSATTSTGTSTEAAVEKDTLKIGVILPLSGELVQFGTSTLEGIKARVKEINDEGSMKISIITEDNKGRKQDSITAYKKLTSLDAVDAVIGPITSTNALGVVREASKVQIPTMSPTATNDKVAPSSPFMFRTCFNDSFQGFILGTHAAKTLKIAKAAVITDMASDYSKGLSKSFIKAFENAGGKIVAQESYQKGDTEFGAQLGNIRKSDAELVFVPGYPPEVPLILRQASSINLDVRFCGADGWDNADVLQKSGDAILGSFIVGAFSAEDQRPAVQNFIKLMGNVGTFEALGYDSVSLITEAAKQQGADPAGIANALRTGIQNFEGVTGSITVKSNGDAIKSGVIMDIYKEGNEYLKKYVATVSP